MDGILLNWVEGEHEFALPLGELRKLQESCNAGPEEILNRLRLGTWRVDDIYETVRLGLIGGGMSNKDAAPLVRRAFDRDAPAMFKLLALSILAHSLFGPADDQPGKPEGATSPENGASAPSTD